MRVLPLVVVLAVVGAGCGAVDDRTGGRPATTAGPAEPVQSLPFDEAEKTRPPPIVLDSSAGRQTAVPGSSCVDYVDEASGHGVGVCADAGPVSPGRLSTVRPGEQIRILLEDADVARPSGCVSEDEQGCIGAAAVHPLGCKRNTVATIPLARGEATTWEVELAPGAYDVDVFAYFDAADGRSGDVSGSLGLLVDAEAPLEIVPPTGHGNGCGQSK